MRWAGSTKKGDLRWFRIRGAREVRYLDLIGSGAETIAHARENGRIVVMFCSFEGPPKIVRLYGRASVVLPDDPGFAELEARFDGKRDQYDGWVDKKVRDGGFDEYIAEKNAAGLVAGRGSVDPRRWYGRGRARARARRARSGRCGGPDSCR